MADSVINYSDLIGEDDTFDLIFDNIDKLKKELNDLTKIAQKDISLINPNNEKQLEKAVKQVDKLVAAKKILDKEEKQAIKTKKKLSQLTDEELIQREKLKIANRERVQIAKQNAILLSKEAGQIEKLRAKLSLTTIQWKKLSKEELENTKKGKNLINTKRKLTDQLKKLEKQTGDTRRNVGNYTSSLGNLGKVAAAVFVGRSIVDGFRRIAGGLTSLVEKNKETSASAKSVAESFEKFAAILEKVGLFIINAIAEPLKSLIAGFESFSKAMFGVDFSAKKASESVSDLQREFNAEIEVLKEGNISQEARKQLIEDINKKYKDYLPNLLDENSSLEDITKAQNAANTAFEKKILLLASEEQFIDITKRRLDALRQESVLQRTLTENQQKLNQAIQANNTSFKSGVNLAKESAEQNISTTNERIKTNKILLDEIEKEKKLLDSIIKTQGISTGDFVSNQKAKTTTTTKSTKAIKDNTDAINANNAARLKAILSIQEQIKQAEVDNIADAQEAAIRLEELRFEAEKAARAESIEKILLLQETQSKLIIAQHGESSQELKDFLEEKRAEIRELDALNDKLEIETLATHEQNKLDIRKDFEDKRIAGIKKTVEQAQKLIKKANKEEQAFLKEQGKINTDEVIKQNNETEKKLAEQRSDNLKKRKEREKEFFDGIIESSKKVGAAIVKTFDKQAELAGSLVKQQADAVETQRKRAEDGLENTLKFEQDQLAKRESERIKAEQKAKNAAKILTLFNLVSAYAQSGDSNALQRGLVDFALLTALESAFTGFEEGGYTGENGKSDVSGVVHGQEYVITAADTAKYGLKNKSGSEFGEAMTDYFNQSPVLTNTYNQQNEHFNKGLKPSNNVDFSRLEMEVRAMRQAFQMQQNNSFDIEEMTDYFVDIAKRITTNRMTTVTKVRKRL